jgi:hypothetical protein
LEAERFLIGRGLEACDLGAVQRRQCLPDGLSVGLRIHLPTEFHHLTMEAAIDIRIFG